MAASNSDLPVLPTSRDRLLGALDRRFRLPLLSSLPNGVPNSSADLASSTAQDIAIVYDTVFIFNSWVSQDLSITLSSQIISNKVPPFMINSTIPFDRSYGWPPSRQVQLQLGSSW